MQHRQGFSLSLALYVLACVLFIVAGFVQPEPWRWRFLVWGLAAWAISEGLPF